MRDASRISYIRRRHTGICCLRLTNIQHGKFNVHNNTFYSVISKIIVNLHLIKFKNKNIIYVEHLGGLIIILKCTKKKKPFKNGHNLLKNNNIDKIFREP